MIKHPIAVATLSAAALLAMIVAPSAAFARHGWHHWHRHHHHWRGHHWHRHHWHFRQVHPVGDGPKIKA